MNIVITAGGTSESIDKVRKITNSGSGRLGAIIADKLAERKDVYQIFYICSRKAVIPKTDKAKIIRIDDTSDLFTAVKTTLVLNQIHWFIHSMAVSDYYVDFVSTAEMIAQDISTDMFKQDVFTTSNIEQCIKNATSRLDNSNKISSSEDNLVLILKQTPKIIGMIKTASPSTHLIGFKLLENVPEAELKSVAYNLLTKNHCDYVVANDLTNIRADKHKAFIIAEDRTTTTCNTKDEIAENISAIIK